MIRWPWRRKQKTHGAHGEDLAAKVHRKAGYEILDRNVKLGRNEVDILARDGDTVVFVEVKTRESPGPAFAPEDNVHATKQRKLINAANHYIARHPDPSTYYRFDIVSVTVVHGEKPRVDLLKDAFHA